MYTMPVTFLNLLVYVLGLFTVLVAALAFWVWRKLQDGDLLYDLHAVEDTIQDFELILAVTMLMAFGAVIFILHGVFTVTSIQQASLLLGIVHNLGWATGLFRFGRRVR